MALAQGLDKAASPFPVGVGLDGVVAHQGWREARGRVLGSLAGGGGGIVALIGPAGTGKTLLLRELARTLRAEGRRVAFVDRPDLDAPAAPPADGDAPAGAPEGARDGGRAGVLLVDEAGRMDDAALERLSRSLDRSGAACVLAGLPGFAHRLKRLGIAADAVDLPPMDVDEVARFVAARLAAAGRKRDLLSPGAVLELAAQSGGIPRLVNMLAGTAVFLASLEGARDVDSRHVLDAASLRAGEQVPAQTQARVQAPPPPAPARAPAAATGRTDAAPSPVPTDDAGHPGRATAAPGGATGTLGGRGPAPGETAAGRPLGPERASVPPRAGSGPTPAPARPRPSILSLPAPHRRPAWIAAAFCLVAAGLWLLPAPARRDPAPAAAPPAALAEVVPAPAPARPAAPEPPPAGAPTPQAPPRARGEDAAARPPPATPPAAPRPRPEQPPPPEAADAAAVAAPPRVVVHAQPGPATAEAGRVAAALEREFGAVELRAVPSSPRTPTVRYFYAEDAPNARRLAGALAGPGEGWRVQYLGTFRPLPRRGTLEVWLP